MSRKQQKSFMEEVLEELRSLKKDVPDNLKKEARNGAMKGVKKVTNNVRSWSIVSIIEGTIKLIIVIVISAGVYKGYKWISNEINEYKSFKENNKTVQNGSQGNNSNVQTSGSSEEESKKKVIKDLKTIIEHAEQQQNIRIARIPYDGVKHQYKYEEGKKYILIEKKGSALGDLMLDIKSAEKRLSPDGTKIQIVAKKDDFKLLEDNVKLNTEKPVTVLKHPEPTFINKTHEQIADGVEYKNFVDKFFRKAYDNYKRMTTEYAKGVTGLEVMAHDDNWVTDFHKTATALMNEELFTDPVIVVPLQDLAGRILKSMYNLGEQIAPELITEAGSQEVTNIRMVVDTEVELIFE